MRTHIDSTHRLLGIIGLLAVFFTFAGAPGCASADRIRILHTNDIHSHQDAYDDFRNGQHRPGTGGAPRRAGLIAAQRSEGVPTLLLDAGDVFQGTPYFNFFQGTLDYQLMALMKYDVGCLGNHDLDPGYAHQAEVMPLAGCPILSANVRVPVDGDSTQTRSLWPADTMITVGGHKLGIFGLTTEAVVAITDKRRNPGLRVYPVDPISRDEVKKLRAAGAEMVVALTHLGVQEDSTLAAHVPGIDLIVGGHSHTFLSKARMVLQSGAANGWGGTAIVQAGRYSVDLGRVDVEFLDHRPSSLEYKLLPIDTTSAEDPAVAAFLRPYKATVDSAMGAVVGTALGDFSQSESGHTETAIGNLVADVLREGTQSDIGLENWGGIRASLSKGPIHTGDVFTMLPFDNEVLQARYTGVQIKALFDYVARTNISRGRGQIAGASFVQTPQGADSILVGGKPLDPSASYTVGTTDFLYNGGDGFIMLPVGTGKVATGRMLRDLTVDYIKKHGTIQPVLDGRLRTH